MANKTQVGREEGRTLDKTTINLKLITRVRWAGNKVMTRIVGGTQVRGGDKESKEKGNQTEGHGYDNKEREVNRTTQTRKYTRANRDSKHKHIATEDYKQTQEV